MRMPAFMLVVCSLVLAGCSDSSSPPREEFEISGTVTDTDGAPVSGVAVILDYRFDQIEGPSPLKAAADLPEPVPVRLMVFGGCGDEVFFDTGMITNPDVGLVQWNGLDLEGLRAPEGVYRYRLEAEGREPVEKLFALALNMGNDFGSFGEDAAEIRATWRLDAMTDARGRFTLDRNCWDFGHTDDWVDEEGTVTGTLLIPHRARLWYYPEGEARGTPGPWVDIDPESGGVLDFALPADVKPRD